MRALRCDATRCGWGQNNDDDDDDDARCFLWYEPAKSSKISGPDHRAVAGWTSAGEGVVVDRCGELSL